MFWAVGAVKVRASLVAAMLDKGQTSFLIYIDVLAVRFIKMKMAHHLVEDRVPSNFIGIVADQTGTSLNAISSAEERGVCLLLSQSVLD